MSMRTVLGCLSILLFYSGCATTLTSQQAVEGLEASAVPLGEFQNVELKRTEIIPALADHPANIQAKESIDRNIVLELSGVFPGLEQLAEGEDFTDAPAARTLQIAPRITNIRFIGTAARFWVGGMAGNSHITLNVAFKDSQSGETIASPSFRREADSMKGGWSVGGTDRAMLVTVTRDAAAYAENNK